MRPPPVWPTRLNARIVHENGHFPKLLNCCLDHRLDVFALAHVAWLLLLGNALLRPPASPVASLGSTIVIRASNQYELQLVFCGSATTCRRHWPPRHTAAWHWLAPTPTPPRRAAATRGAYVARELEPVWCTLSEISALLTVTLPSSSRSSSQVDSAGTARVRRRAARQRGSNSQRAQNGPCWDYRSCPDFRNRPVEFSLYSCGKSAENSAWRKSLTVEIHG
eukprot:COSAG06_NODE_1626_length_8883_cov_5.163251_2_plen_222_part_00